MPSPFEIAELLLIGTVEFVSNDTIHILLDIDAPESVALNAVTPRPFPRVNGYVLVSTDEGYLVAQVEWLTIERSPFPKRFGIRDFGIVDLPYPRRKMKVYPLGMLRRHRKHTGKYAFQRGAGILPAVGSAALLPTDLQLRTIVEADDGNYVQIGVSPLAGFAKVRINPDRMFGRHLAVLGNTGSGKSCSVAGLIRWSLEEAENYGKVTPNARFIILDPNGEYSRAFSDNQTSISARIFKVDPKTEVGQCALTVPLWLWNSAEWLGFTQASLKTQRPILIEALRMARSGISDVNTSKLQNACNFMRSALTTMRNAKRIGKIYNDFGPSKGFWASLANISQSLRNSDVATSLCDDDKQVYEKFLSALDELVNNRSSQYGPFNFSMQEVDDIIVQASEVYSILGGDEVAKNFVDADTPCSFSGELLIRNIDLLAQIRGVTEYVEPLKLRIKALLSDSRINKITGFDESMTLAGWLGYMFGDKCDMQKRTSNISILDLSLVPTDIVHTITAVITRVIFEALQRHRKLTDDAVQLPTVLVMEEAHTFIKRYREDAEFITSANICCQIFERVAREGRKFGLGLVLSSQRPSELSQTVLSQCNTFLLHRISNERDQEIVHKLVPDGMRGILRELPMLQSQYAILLGWASELPVLVQMTDLPRSQRPQSDDPEYWKSWTMSSGVKGTLSNNKVWEQVANHWQEGNQDEPV